jgi:photosystem II stability/assembly factor-like uncharacterized protein
MESSVHFPDKLLLMKNNFLPCIFLFLFLSICPVVFCIAQPANWQPRGIGGGGSLFYPTINPANDNEFYVTCDMGELFHSTDFGASYTHLSFTQFVSGNISTYEFTSNNNVAYCIGNDGNINYGVVTTNGGTTWTALPGNPIAGEPVYILKADYANPGRIVLGYYGSLYISNDFGATFSLIWTAADNGVGIPVAGIFFDGNNIYIGTNEGVLYSSNGGSSFAKLSLGGIPSTESIFSFAGAKVGTVTRFFCLTSDAANIYNGIFPWDYYGFIKGVYSFDAGSGTWVSKTSGIDVNNDFMMYVGMANNDINTVYLGGSDAGTGGNSVLKTSDAGNTWNRVFLTVNNQNIRTGWSGQGGDRGWGFGEMCFGISVAPNNSNKVLFGDYGFVHKTSDGGASWQQAYVNPADEHAAGGPTPTKQYYHSIGLENTSAWQVHWQDANNVFASYSDIFGIRSKDAGLTWSFDYTGPTTNTIYRIAEQTSGTTMYAATSGVHDMYQSTRLQDALLDATDNGGRIIYSVNNGAAWTTLHQFNHPVFWVATDPSHQNRMYASVIQYANGTGQGGIWMTNDLNNLGTSTWTKLANPPRTQGHPASIIVLNDGKMVCTFSGRRDGSGAFTASSGVFLYDAVADSWTDVSDAAMQYWTKDIIIDPTDATQNTWYVAVFSGWGGAPNGKGGLYRTINRGASWTKLTGTQFDRVTSISFNPAISNQAYLTTETNGLWISNNMNAAVPSWSLVNSYTFKQPERVYFNPYNASEIWVSSFGNGLNLGVQSVALPVQLVSFAGHRDKSLSTIQWVAADEDNGDKFDIERSTDGLHFNRIATVMGKTGALNQYQLTDTSAETVLYYRIKVTSIAGNYFYSRVIVLRDNNITGNYIRLVNNPVAGNIPLQASVEKAENLQLSLMDLSGKQLLKQTISVQAGINQLNVALPSTCNKAVYLLQVVSAQLNSTMRIMVANR